MDVHWHTRLQLFLKAGYLLAVKTVLSTPSLAPAKMPVGPFKFSSHPGKGSLQAATTMLRQTSAFCYEGSIFECFPSYLGLAGFQ